MSALDIKLAINQALANVPGSREETITINSNVHFFNLTCSGGMMLEEKRSGYATLTPDISYEGAPDGAVVIFIDGQTHVDIFQDPEKEKTFEEEAIIRTKALIREHCNAYCEGGTSCHLRRKEG